MTPPVDQLGYVELISLVNETNRPPGGKHTVRYWIQNAYLDRTSRVLEIGCNTGFTALELARCTGCQVTGIDVSEAAIAQANLNLQSDCLAIRERVTFILGDVEALSFPDHHYDAVVCGGALSFVRNRDAAVRELHRVLRPWGFLCVSPLCYHSEPPPELLAEIAEILGFSIPRLDAQAWIDLLTASGFEKYHTAEVKLQAQPEERVRSYVGMLISSCRADLDAEARQCLSLRLLHIFSAFNRNHEYLQYLAGVFRRRHVPEQEELFTIA